MSPSSYRNLPVVLGVIVVALATGVAGWWWGSRAKPMLADAPVAQSSVLYWFDPMKPEQHFDKPGKSPYMDMDLLPRYAEPAGKPVGVEVSAAVQESLGMRLAQVERLSLDSSVDASGILGYNERDVAVVQSRASGIVERVWPLAPGDRIAAGSPVVELLVPDWSAAQLEFLAVRSSGDAALLEGARDRLRLLGLDESQITALERDGVASKRFTVRAPLGGVVVSVDVRAGMTVGVGQMLLRINGLGTVWLEVAVPESLAGSIHVGGHADVRLASTPGELLAGRISAVLPTLNEATRTLRVRVALANLDGKLKPGQSARVTLRDGAPMTALVVPTEAVIRTGKRSLVMLADKGRFHPTVVTVGQEFGDKTVIVEGVDEGQQVVASGQFLLDSEASLRGLGVASEEGAK